jgi:N-sulfoglucosamine sulfohydrolase
MSGRTFRALNEAATNDPRIKARVDQLVFGIPLALYDLEKDADERKSVLDDKAYHDDVEGLSKRLLAHMERTKDPQLDGFKAALAKWKDGK